MKTSFSITTKDYALFFLANVLQCLGFNQQCQLVLTKLLALRKAYRGAQDKTTAHVMVKLASAYMRGKDEQQAKANEPLAKNLLAENLLIEAQAIYLLYDECHWDRANAMRKLGVLYDKLNRLDEAKKLFKQCIALFEQSSPLDRADAMVLLADVLFQQGNTDDAEHLRGHAESAINNYYRRQAKTRRNYQRF